MKLFFKDQQLNEKFIRAFGTHSSPFANDVITDAHPHLHLLAPAGHEP